MSGPRTVFAIAVVAAALVAPGSARTDDSMGDVWIKLVPLQNQGRRAHTVTALLDGTAIAAFGTPGGLRFDGLTTTDIFDPVANVWQAGPSLPPGASGRVFHSAVRIADGRVLFCGGMSFHSDYRNYLGPPDIAPYLTECWLYDPASQSFSPTGSLPPDSRAMGAESCATLLNDGRVLFCGGAAPFTVATSKKSAVWDPSTGAWTPTPDMNSPHLNFGTGVVLGSGNVLVAGGHAGPAEAGVPWNVDAVDQWTTVCELFHPTTNTWTVTDPLPVIPSETDGAGNAIAPPSGAPADWAARRELHVVTPLPDGRAFLSGGLGPSPTGAIAGLTARNSCLIFDENKPDGQKWSVAASMHEADISHFAKLHALTKKVMKVGGINANLDSSLVTEFYDPATDSWTVSASLPTGPADPAAAPNNVPTMGGLEIQSYIDILPNGNAVFAYGTRPEGKFRAFAPGDADNGVVLFVKGF
jgi:hypothetical protein